jgi:hypothetical protein
MTAIALVLQWVVLGLHVVVPWQLARTAAEALRSPAAPETGKADPRWLWAMAATPLLLGAALAGLFSVGTRIDAALAWGIRWPPTSVPAIAILLSGLAVGVGDLLLLAGHRRLEPAAWRVAAILAALLLVAASVGGELLRLGRGPAAGLGAILGAALCRVPLALAAGEAAAGRVRWLAPLAGAVLPCTLLAFSAPMRAGLGPDVLTLGAASLLLLAAPFLPLALRRPAAFAGILLAALFLDRTGDLQASYEPGATIPDIFMPQP